MGSGWTIGREQLSDVFDSYTTGLTRLLERLGQDHPQYTEALTLEAQLRENVSLARSEGDSETRRADRNRILRELNRLALQASQVSFNELCGVSKEGVDLAQALAAGVTPAEAGRPRLDEAGRPLLDMVEFVNRELELYLLRVEWLRASRSPYTLISAPAGYGKSYLLQRLMQTIDADEALHHKWSACYVDCVPRTQDQVVCIARSIAGPSLQIEPKVSTDLVCDYVLRELSTPLPEGRRAVLLIFDAVERLDEKARGWLATLLNDLRTCTRPGGQEIIIVRVIVAGRNVESFWEEYARAFPRPPAPQRIDLSPFNEHPIQELLWSRAQAVKVADRLDDQTVVQMAEELRYLSGGHPKVIRGLVDDLASRSFAVGPVSEYFARHREQLVRTYVSPVADDLLGGLETKTREALQALSVFRQVNANTVQALVQGGLLSPEINAIDVLGDLQRAHLLDGPSIREPFYRDRLIRRVLALDMAYRSPASHTRYLRLNKTALTLYRNWIHNLGPALLDTHLKAIQRLLSVLEWLFHVLRDEDVDSQALCVELRTHVAALSTGDQVPSVVDLVTDEIMKDVEICYLVRHRLGDDGISNVCGWLQSL